MTKNFNQTFDEEVKGCAVSQPAVQLLNFDDVLFIRALPDEYLVRVGRKKLDVELGGTAFRLFGRYLKIPASAETTTFRLECSSKNYMGIIVEGYVVWRIAPDEVEKAVRCLDFYDKDNPLFRTGSMLGAMAIDAVRRSVAQLDVQEILNASEILLGSIKKKLEDVNKWGLLIDTLGINRIYIKSDKIFSDLQAEDRNKLRQTAETSVIETEHNIDKEKLTVQKEKAILQSEVAETEFREKAKQERNKQEFEIEQSKLEAAKKEEKIKVDTEVEQKSYEYFKMKLANDVELQQTRVKIDMENLKVEQEKKEVEGYISDRQIHYNLVDKLKELGNMYKNANLTVFSSKEDASFFGPVLQLVEMVKGFVPDKKEHVQK
jgi:hypothetical protein